MAKRNIFGELMEGVAAMKSHREGKLTLRTCKVEAAPLPKVDSKFLRDTRKKLRCSRAVFARKLRINERTLEKWEQGRAKPNPQAAALVLLVRRHPDTLARLDELAVRWASAPECQTSVRRNSRSSGSPSFSLTLRKGWVMGSSVHRQGRRSLQESAKIPRGRRPWNPGPPQTKGGAPGIILTYYAKEAARLLA